MAEHILVINPGSTSTKVAVFDGEKELFSHTAEHEKHETLAFNTAFEQMELRRSTIKAVLKEYGMDTVRFAGIAGRGGLLAPMHGGTWNVTPAMLTDLESARYGEHACNLGAPLALEFAKEHGVKAYIVDTVVTDEMDSRARLSGLPELPRRSVFHALSQRAAARKAAEQLGKEYADSRFLVCHMGGGVSVAAHRNGKICDVVNALEGDGPFSPERTGRLTALGVLDLVKNGTFTYEELRSRILKTGGLWAHLGTNDLREVEKRMAAGDTKAQQVFDALAYCIAKELSGLLPALMHLDEGESAPVTVDGYVLTGGMANSKKLVETIINNLPPLAPAIIFPAVEEMHALAGGVLRVLRGKEDARDYTGTPKDLL
ncbi:butyrate kinase [Halodesulfovibrio sp.]|uniref:butyrate kinase n=1 Tax=Halodesulfovibrio sp. TaxID=1912772 RepID=UPI0025BFFE1E|nr:butyrate kinase [Halodesulfovibrio sp.]